MVGGSGASYGGAFGRGDLVVAMRPETRIGLARCDDLADLAGDLCCVCVDPGRNGRVAPLFLCRPAVDWLAQSGNLVRGFGAGVLGDRDVHYLGLPIC